jgi:hypothetical protein
MGRRILRFIYVKISVFVTLDICQDGGGMGHEFERSTTLPKKHQRQTRWVQRLTDDLQDAPNILPLTPLRFNPEPAPDDIDTVEPSHSDETGEGCVPGFGRG